MAISDAARFQRVEFHMTTQEEGEFIQTCMKPGMGNKIVTDFTREEYRAYRMSIVNKTSLTERAKREVRR
jgi:hypothetical protein